MIEHWSVRKKIRDDCTFTEITPFVGEDRVAEIARRLGGEPLTSVVRRPGLA